MNQWKGWGTRLIGNPPFEQTTPEGWGTLKLLAAREWDSREKIDVGHEKKVHAALRQSWFGEAQHGGETV
jgi:hypothetical protein